MNKNKKKHLKNKGWVIGDTKEFLNLSPEEVAYVELKLWLGKNLQNDRRQKNITREKLTKMIKSSPSGEASLPSSFYDRMRGRR